ncbi:hypothetical protein [Janthinobacterium sp. BJB401]|uniref:hypothetical protein n=1 Tax=Janthinobacterium sp. BJB401 TaxID=2745934 RepID=UPI001C3DA17E|nr:hypothetical protein [Janthinobacterium sp. BJB401]
MCEWARAESSSERFGKKLRTEGAAGEKLVHYEAVRTILTPHVLQDELDAVAFRLLAHFTLIRLDMLTEGSPTEANTVSLLANALAPIDRERADDLWRRLLALIRVSQGRAAAFDRKTLVARLNGAFRLSGGPSLRAALQAIEHESRLAVAEIGDDISGLNVPRDRHVKSIIDAIATPGFYQITGKPGAGKSAVLRSAIECLLEASPVIFLKSDRLQGATWSQYATTSGISHTSLEELLVELGAAGTGVLFIDGIDRIEVAHRGIVLDLLNTIHNSPHLSDWCIVATVRDTGMEPLRTWLPSQMFARGIRSLVVDSFNDEEAKILAKGRPELQHLLFGPAAVQSVVRRPFFAAVLAKESDAGNTAATSEVDLAALWWQRGGYAADHNRVGYRRKALVELAKLGAHQLGRRIPAFEIDAQILAELEADGIIRAVRMGHTVQFVHDIFFEWAFLQYLVSEGDTWFRVIHQIGEPPALGRVVELLSQMELLYQENWTTYLIALETDTMLRSQWLRAWLAGPFALETFEEHSSTFSQAMLDPAHTRVGKLVVWYQAEKTRPNAKILNRGDLPAIDIAERMMYADMFGYPSDIPAWARFCNWLLDNSAYLPTNILPDVVAAFGVWQNAFANFHNPVSERIIQTCLAWLYHIEHERHRKEFTSDYGVWRTLDRKGVGRDDLEHLEQSLRSMVLSAALAQRTQVAQYVRDLHHLERMPREVVKALFSSAPFLARTCPAELVDFMLRFVRKRLPVDVERYVRGHEYRVSRSFGQWDWDKLSIEDNHNFFPAAPTREPFHSLFEEAPDEGRRLIRELANHSIQAWRQLHRLSYERKGTAIPVVMQFPWGRQMFWGGKREYMGARGNWSPSTVNSGWMALEAWAFRQLEKGVPIDEILQDVLEGHRSVGALAVATAIITQAQHSSAACLPLAINQRVWCWDIERRVHDMMQMANLIGFKPYEQTHAKAVRDGNTRPVRRQDIRSLTMLILLNGGELGAQAGAAIQRFPEELPFNYVEERENESIIADLSSTAKIWAEFGKTKNYRAEVSEDKSKIVISLENPKSTGPEFDAMRAKHDDMSRNLRILNWVHGYFDGGKLANSLTIEEAVAAAKELQTPDLFEAGYPGLDPRHQRQAAVAAVAAIVVAENAVDHVEWAVEVCIYASQVPEIFDDFFIKSAILMHHPVLFATSGLGACFKLSDDEQDILYLQSQLTKLVAHPYEEITVAALKGLLGTWESDSSIGWAALCLATEHALVEVRHDLRANESQLHRQTYVHAVIDAELERISEGNTVKDTQPSLPAPWIEVSVSDSAPKRRGRGHHQESGWKLNAMQVDVAFLQKIIGVIPIDAAVADKRFASQFLDWCEDLVRWTTERVAPSWVTSKRELEVDGADFYEWKRYLYAFLAKVSLCLPAEEGIRRFLAPAVAADDDTFGSVAEEFTGHLIAAVVDSPEIPPVALTLLSAVAQRVLQYRGWHYAGEPGGRTDREIIEIVQDLFFSKMPYAELSARFANREWSEVEVVIPIFEPILKAHGSVAFVAGAWMTLCETSFEHYPVEHFVSSLDYMFVLDGSPSGWRDAQLPARLSGLIQRFSEREQPMPVAMAQKLLRALDRLVDMGDRRAAAVQLSEIFRSVRVVSSEQDVWLAKAQSRAS